jgi:hypothetical protein
MAIELQPTTFSSNLRRTNLIGLYTHQRQIGVVCYRVMRMTPICVIFESALTRTWLSVPFTLALLLAIVYSLLVRPETVAYISNAMIGGTIGIVVWTVSLPLTADRT